MQLVFKLRLRPPIAGPSQPNGTLPDPEKERRDGKFNDERDQAFLVSKKDFEDLPLGEPLLGWAHAPRWPAVRVFFTFRIWLVSPVSFTLVVPVPSEPQATLVGHTG